MKKFLLTLSGLVIIDQVVKLFISHYFTNTHAILLPGILIFRPVQNENLTWISSIMDYNTPVWLMLILQLFASAFVVLVHRYLFYLWSEKKRLLKGMLDFLLAGIICSLIDVVFWGGSLDYIRLFNWFTFDMKDVYLNIGVFFAFLYGGMYYFQIYRKLSGEERRQTGLLRWLKRGMPSCP